MKREDLDEEIGPAVRGYGVSREIAHAVHDDCIHAARLQKTSVKRDRFRVGGQRRGENRDRVAELIIADIGRAHWIEALGKSDFHLIGVAAGAHESRRIGIVYGDNDRRRVARATGIIGGARGEAVNAVFDLQEEQAERKPCVFAEFLAALEKFHFADGSIGIRRVRGEGDVRWANQNRAVRGVRDGDSRRGVSDQFQVEHDIRTGAVGLMNFDCEDIGPGHEQIGRGAGKERGFAGAIDDRRSEGRIQDVALWHVAAEDLSAVQVNDTPVIAPQPHFETAIHGGITNDEPRAKISRSVLGIWVRPEGNRGCDRISIA